MSQASFKIVFSGELLPDAQLEQVQANLTRLFKADSARIAALFSGKPVEIKRGLSDAQAEQYLKALHQAGAKARKVQELAASIGLLETDDHPTEQAQHSSAPSMACPKCGHQQVQAKECAACGIIIDKYLARQTALEQESTPLSAQSPYATPQAASLRAAGEHDALRIFTSDGRIGRMRYLVWSMLMLISLLPITLVIGTLANPIFTLIIGAVLLIGLTLMFTIKRLHDLGWSGWLWLLSFVPVVGSLFNLLIMILPGNAGSNLYGSPPPPNSRAVKILFGLWLGVIVLGIVAAILLPGLANLPSA